MSGQIRVSPETLKTRAKEYGRAANDINQILNNLQRLQDTLRSEWEGEAFNGFDNQFNELKPKVQNFAELMQQINVQLDKTADIMTENDLAIKSGFGLNHG
ncbi:WXG100 family type VII secretion target [Streptococcus acidominimus]|uniref:ESAT-6-like protein n=1 Tax=Streptococcus acidominimus TaxID=1326 RepID=A0A1Q8EC02_STRAI|nr:WXG100 family type VII secretion target [Streptococcus acidominimus]OLF49333.1 type VII secretion protein EsxA [Streptococcus acidominimus]SUN07512.1 ESAT-6/Esx family secreted protein EsxA/YukE [Streptococcus acidominimus]